MKNHKNYIPKKITVIILFILILFSCGKKVVNVPIFIDINGFDTIMDTEDFEDVLIENLEKYNFKIVTDTNRALYTIFVENFYSVESFFIKEAPYNDCYYGEYILMSYSYSIDAHLFDIKNNNIVENWYYSNSKSDEVVEDGEEAGCIVYRIKKPIFTASTFFNLKAKKIARQTSEAISVR